MKTHDRPADSNPAIYVVRDGRTASVSLWRFLGERQPLKAVIAGQHKFGTWSDHLTAWSPGTRPNTLLVKYEEMISNLPHVLETLSGFLSCEIKSDRIPDRDSIVGIDGHWVRKKRDWKPLITTDVLELFNQINRTSMKKMGYYS